MASQTIKIAITGHKDVRPEDKLEIRERVKNRLVQLTEGRHVSQIRLFCGMAEGADRLVAEVANELNIPVHAIFGFERDKIELPETIQYISSQIVSDEKDEKKIENTEGVVYEQVGKILIQNANYLIALWDGVFNGKQGGTSEVVRMAMESNKPITINHLIIPRAENPYPVASLLKQGMSFHAGKFQRIPFTVPFSWVELAVKPVEKDNLFISLIKNIWQKLGSNIFLSFLLPMILVVLTLYFGTKGFLQLEGNTTRLNAFFKAVNLITFNNSVIEHATIPFQLNLARISGVLFAISAFSVALYYTLGSERKRLRVFRWKLVCSHKYNIVLGLSEKSFVLIKDLIKKGEKVAVIDPDEQSIFKSDIEKLGAVFMKGSISSSRLFQKIYFDKANAIYIMSDSDSDNVRAVQELDTIAKEDNQKWYVHAQNTRLKNFLYNNLSKNAQSHLYIFDVYENIARRLQLYYPMDRFYQTPKANEAHIIIFGFDELGKQIAVNALRRGHFELDKKLKISVFCENALSAKNRFENEFPIFKTDNSIPKHLSAIKNNIWQDDTIHFYELPQSDAELLAGNLFRDIIKTEHIVSLYSCFESGMASGAYLSAMLPKLNFESNSRNCNLQAFCFYNFPDKDEEKTIERNFNKLAPNIPVFCFGNFIDECSADSISDMALDALSKQIAYWYEQAYGDKNKPIGSTWRDCSEQDKQSNRQAADHLWIKLRTVWSDINWKFNTQTFEPEVDEELRVIKENMLAEIEHRRWCAHLLIEGYRPLQDETTDTKDFATLKSDWFDKGMKKIYKEQKLHIDLIPFNDLDFKEKNKDLSQIQDIPKFLRAIVEV